MTSVYLCFMMSLILQQITNDSVKILANLAILMQHCKDILVVMIIIRRLICAYDIEYHEWHWKHRYDIIKIWLGNFLMFSQSNEEWIE